VVLLVVADGLGGRGPVMVATVVRVDRAVLGGPLTDDTAPEEVADGLVVTDADEVGTTGTVVDRTDEPAGAGSGSTTAAVVGTPSGWSTRP